MNLGSSWRGVTAQQKIDSWKISTDLGGTDTPSVLRAYDRAVAWSEWGVVATIQVNETPTDGQFLVNFSAQWKPLANNRALTLILSADNIFDVDARRHTSLTKDYVPLSGRDIRLTARLSL